MPINKSIASRSFETSEGRNVLASLDFSGHLMDAWPWETKRISWMGALSACVQNEPGIPLIMTAAICSHLSGGPLIRETLAKVRLATCFCPGKPSADSWCQNDKNDKTI